MADAIIYARDNVTQQTISLTSRQEVSAYTVTWAQLTGQGFANGDTVIIVVRWMQGIDSTSALSTVDLRVGDDFATATIDETFTAEGGDATAANGSREMGWVWQETLATNDNIYMGLSSSSGGTNAAVQDWTIHVFKIGTGGLGVDDYRFTNQTSPPAAGTNLTGASVTLPASGGDDWGLIGCGSFPSGGSTATSVWIDIAGTDRMIQRTEGEDFSDVISHLVIAHYPNAANSAVCTFEMTNVDFAFRETSLFAIRLSLFTDSAGNMDQDVVAMGGVVDTYVPTNTATLTMTATGQASYFAQTIADIASASQKPYHRVQDDGADFITSMGRVAHTPFDAFEPGVSSFGAKSLTSGANVIDVDCAEDILNTAYNFDEHALFAFSWDIASADSEAPVLSSTSASEGSNGPTEADIDFTSNEDCDYDVYISTNATETEATIASNSYASGSATASVAVNLTDVPGVTPGTQSYAHVRAEDAAANVSVTSFALSTVTTAYSGSATYDGTAIPPTNSVLSFRDDLIHDGLANAAALTDASAAMTVDEFVTQIVTFTIHNITDTSSGTITDNTATVVTATLAGGTDNDWDIGDAGQVVLEADINDVIKYPTSVTITAGSCNFPWYLEDNSASTYSEMHDTTVTGLTQDGQPYTGTGTLSIGVTGIPQIAVGGTVGSAGLAADEDELFQRKKPKDIDNQMFNSDANFSIDSAFTSPDGGIDEA